MDLNPIFDVSCGHFHVDGESSGSKMSLDEKLGILFVVSLGTRKSRHAIKTHRVDVGTCKSVCVKYLVDRHIYDGFLAHH